MARFSERIGKKSLRVEIQLDSMDNALRNSLWNVISMFVNEPISKRQWLIDTEHKAFIEMIWFTFLKEPIDQIPYETADVIDDLRIRFFDWDYLEVYDFVDFIACCELFFNSERFIDACNVVLKRELSAYRFIAGKLAPITNEYKVKEIEKSLLDTSSVALRDVQRHLMEAVDKLSDRNKPDYRNSIKESISAVESLCQKITSRPKATLGEAIKVLKSKIEIHKALESSFDKIYGYTSDADGIRHAMVGESKLGQEDALYMLVVCSSFVNYLIVKANKAGINLS